MEPQVFDQRLPMCHPSGVLTVNAKLAFDLHLLRAKVSSFDKLRNRRTPQRFTLIY